MPGSNRALCFKGRLIYISSVSKPPKAKPPTAYVYIDGFNLYYGALLARKDSFSRKWLDLESLVSKLLKPKSYDVAKIKYFTADVMATHDPKKLQRQQYYWRALATLPKVEKFEGKFLMKGVTIPISPGVSLRGRVPEEKGTDVNLAAHLVNDAHLGKFDIAAVISNDSDLAEAVRIVTQEVGLPVITINPCNEKLPSAHLGKFSSGKKEVRDGQITSSQFPINLTDAKGTFTKPKEW